MGRRPPDDAVVAVVLYLALHDLNLTDGMEVNRVNDFRSYFRRQRFGRFVPSAIFLQAEEFA